MSRNRSFWWPFYRRKDHQSREPGAALFEGLRMRLTLWYCGVLGTALVLFCVVLYLIAQYVLLTPIENGTSQDAQRYASQWHTNESNQMCVPDGPPPSAHADDQQQHILACFDQKGTLLRDPNTAQLPSAFLANTLVKTALQDGSAHDTVNGGDTIGTIYRYAVAVPGATGQGYVGVVLSGGYTQQENMLLSTLLVLLLTVGGATLLGAGFGGLFLASRALAPAHLAFARQQHFIADASHELRTPLTLMRADAEVLLRGREQMAVEDALLLEDIVEEVKHMNALATSMLTLARLDAGLQHREHEVVNLDALTLQGVQRVTAFAEQKGVIVQRESADEVFVIGDPMQLEQAVLVLLDNAIKYNRPGGQVTVRTSVKNGLACLEVIDTGIGIATEHLPHLGQRFYRVDKARAREDGGTGLGLSIAQRITTIHNGTFSLTSVLNQGTTITILLPLAHSTPSQRETKE
jgi:signal transduction histidine kinase